MEKSPHGPMFSSGVTPCLVLGLILFTIYLNDIDSDIKSKVSKFADDTKLGSFLPDGCPRSSTPLRPCAPVFIPGVLVERDVTGATPQKISNPPPFVLAGLGL